jgi:hypothetical protein
MGGISVRVVLRGIADLGDDFPPLLDHVNHPHAMVENMVRVLAEKAEVLSNRPKRKIEIGRAIPTKWYQAVAEILSMIYKLKRKAG